MRKNEWSDQTADGDAYVGCEAKEGLIYVGGPYYGEHAQVHLTVKQAREVRKLLSEAIKRCVARKGKELITRPEPPSRQSGRGCG